MRNTTRSTDRNLAAVLLALALTPASHAQTLFVADTEFPDQVTAMQAALTSAGVTYTTYTVNAQGDNPPSYATLNQYSTVIWYCGSDGTNLGFWNGVDAITDYAYTNRKLWIIGQDLLYAVYSAPSYFGVGTFPYDIMGIESYLVQSYGDDGGQGCPQMVAAPGLGAQFQPTLTWIFSTLWWADGCELVAGATPIYNMGPGSYSLAGFTSMVSYRDPGVLNVLTTLFEPTYINPAQRVTFVQQSLAYLNQTVGVEEAVVPQPVRLLGNPATDQVTIMSDEPISTLMVHDLSGAEVAAVAGLHTLQHNLGVNGLASGTYLLTVTASNGARHTLRFVKQ